MDQNKPQRFYLSRERNPELLACFAEANKRLKAKLEGSARTRRPMLQNGFVFERGGKKPF